MELEPRLQERYGMTFKRSELVDREKSGNNHENGPCLPFFSEGFPKIGSVGSFCISTRNRRVDGARLGILGCASMMASCERIGNDSSWFWAASLDVGMYAFILKEGRKMAFALQNEVPEDWILCLRHG